MKPPWPSDAFRKLRLFSRGSTSAAAPYVRAKKFANSAGAGLSLDVHSCAKHERKMRQRN